MSARLMLVAISGALLLMAGAYIHGVRVTDIKWMAKTQQRVNEAVSEARADEKRKQGIINATLQKQADSMRLINDRLQHDIDGLRNRPDRQDLPDHPRADCSGASGAELARIHAEFLTRFSALAAKQDAALMACYEYADSLTLAPVE